jgi:tetratricopeptide (TPR) repeat protein
VRRDSRAYRLRRFVVRNRVAVTAASAVMLALAVGFVATLWQAREARQEAEHANTIKQFVLSVIQEADPQASQRTREADMTLLDATRERVAKELTTRPDLQLEVRLAIATAYRNRGAWEPARQTLRKAVDDARGKVSENSMDLLTARLRLAEWPIVDGTKALEELDAIVAAARGLGKPAVPLLIDALLARKSLKGALEIDEAGDDPMASAFAEAREIVALAEQTYAVGHPKWAEAQMSMVNALAGAGKRKEALAAIEPIYHAARASAVMGAGHPVMLRLQAGYGGLLCANGRKEEGARQLREHLELARAHHGPGSRVLGDALMKSSDWFFYVSGDYKQIIEMRREAYAIAAAMEPLGSLRRSAIANEVAHTIMGAWRPQEAFPLIEEVRLGHQNLPEGKMRTRVGWWLDRLVVMTLFSIGANGRARYLAEELVKKAEGPQGSPWWAFMAGYDLAAAMRIAGDFAAAETTAERLVAEVRRRPDLEFGFTGALGELAGAKLGLGKWQETIAALDEVLGIRTSNYGQRTPFMPDDALFNLWRGQALLHLGRLTEALEEFQVVVAFWRDFDADHPMAAEAAWWYGHSLIATGEVMRGKAMVAAARPRLAASFLPHLRPLAEAPAPVAMASK